MPTEPLLAEVDYEPPGMPARRITVTSEQQHERACVVCGNSQGALVPAGHVYTCVGDGRYGWPVVAHPEHLETP